MKVGVLTYHRSHNYGAYLQAYSLSHAINAIEGFECELINYNLESEDEIYKKRKYKRPIYYFEYFKQDKMFERLQSEQLLSGDLILDNDYTGTLEKISKDYDVLVVGSDEIWRIATRGFPNIYWLPLNTKAKKMSYAASGRMKIDNLSTDVRTKLGELYSDFDYIGVRDSLTKKMVEGVTDNIQAEINCDPAFLYDRFGRKSELKQKLRERLKVEGDKKIVAVMYDRPNIITRLRKILGKDYCFVCIARPMWNADRNLTAVTPFEWVDIIGGADYLVSSYFHGMVFAINQNTPFSVIDRRANKSNCETSKLYDLLGRIDLLDKYYCASDMSEKDYEIIANEIKEGQEVDFSSAVELQRKTFDNFVGKIKELCDE
ncbi:MAG: polysaccharide pyruvyl transferase family protein [Lachnospiraceae bacterium]|nr:polysaccharide pyruvyl transferase family protein [Lachnospiraceae bacterium]